MQPTPNERRTWAAKFGGAIRGVGCGVAGESSFLVHGVAAVVVVAAAAALRVSVTEWCLLTLCIAGVLVSEMFNSALESMAKAVDQERNAALGEALDIASGAVLVAAVGSMFVGVIVFVPYLWPLLTGVE
jgi:diacylglycerol kinase